MEKKNNVWVMVVIILVSLLVGWISGYFINDKALSIKTTTNNNGENIETSNKTNNSNENNSDNIATESYENNFQLYSNNLKNNKYNKLNNSNYITKSVETGCVDGGYNVLLDSNKLYVEYNNNELKQKFGKKKIADNVLNYYLINVGQNICSTLYYINENGTVSSANIESSVQSGNDIEIKNNIGNYKNIISVVDAIFGDDNISSHGPLFIDINGNIYSENLGQ